MIRSTEPLVVEVLGVGYRFTSASQRQLVTRALDLCDGAGDTASLAQGLTDEGLATPEESAALVNDLIQLGIIVTATGLAAEFHEVSANPQRFVSALTTAEIIEHQAGELRDGDPESVLDLPDPSPGGLWALTAARHSSRQFAAEPLSSAELAQLLSCAYGPQRPVASAGDLRPLHLSVILPRQVDGIEAGVYRYDSSQHGLLPVSNWSADSRDSLEFALDSDTCLGESPAILVISASLERQPHKYGPRGYRYTLYEAGEVAQSYCLAAEELALGAFVYGGFKDDDLARFLDLAEGDRPLLVIGSGRPAESPALTSEEVAFSLEHALVSPAGPIGWLRLSQMWPDELCSMLAVASYTPGPHDRGSSTDDHVGGGIATTTAIARIRALGEAYERYCSGQVRIDSVAAARDLDADWIDPRIYCPYSDEQYERYPVLARFGEDDAIEWVAGQAMDGAVRYVPADLVYYPFLATEYGRSNIHWAGSNGAAAHQTRAQAIDAAALELIERDCLGRMWLNRTPPRRVELAAFTGRSAAQAEYLASFDYTITLFDLSAHGAAVAMVMATSESASRAVTLGTAAHRSSWLAAARKAMEEALNGAGQQQIRHVQLEEVSTGEDHADFWADPERIPLLDFVFEGPVGGPPADQEGPDLLELDVTAVSLTPQDRTAPLEVVRTFSPLLLPFWFGWGMEHYTHQAVAEPYDYPGLPHPLA